MCFLRLSFLRVVYPHPARGHSSLSGSVSWLRLCRAMSVFSAALLPHISQAKGFVCVRRWRLERSVSGNPHSYSAITHFKSLPEENFRLQVWQVCIWGNRSSDDGILWLVRKGHGTVRHGCLSYMPDCPWHFCRISFKVQMYHMIQPCVPGVQCGFDRACITPAGAYSLATPTPRDKTYSSVAP
jgi:hypothetical protein